MRWVLAWWNKLCSCSLVTSRKDTVSIKTTGSLQKPICALSLWWGVLVDTDCSCVEGAGDLCPLSNWSNFCYNWRMWLHCSCVSAPLVSFWWSEVSQLCPTLRDPMDCSLSGSSVHGIFQARVLEWIAISFSKGIFPTQESNLGLPHCRQTLYHLSHQRSLLFLVDSVNLVIIREECSLREHFPNSVWNPLLHFSGSKMLLSIDSWDTGMILFSFKFF